MYMIRKFLLFMCGKYRKSIVVEHRKQIWVHYREHGFTNTGYVIYKGIK